MQLGEVACGCLGGHRSGWDRVLLGMVRSRMGKVRSGQRRGWGMGEVRSSVDG